MSDGLLVWLGRSVMVNNGVAREMRGRILKNAQIARHLFKFHIIGGT